MGQSSSCAHLKNEEPVGDVKFYSIQADDLMCPIDLKLVKEPWCAGKSGLYRFKDKTVIPFSEARNFIGMTPDDVEKLPLLCPRK